MARFNTAARRKAGSGPVQTASFPVGVTHEGAPGYERDAKSELFLLAVAHLGDASFYESAPERDNRFTALVRAVTAQDRRWMARFVPWLRDGAGMRTAAVVAAAEAAKALLEAGQPGGRQLIANTLQRADEPGELLAYWMSRHGRTIPKPVKRGIGDAMFRLFAEYPLLKYDTGAHAFRVRRCSRAGARGRPEGQFAGRPVPRRVAARAVRLRRRPPVRPGHGAG